MWSAIGAAWQQFSQNANAYGASVNDSIQSQFGPRTVCACSMFVSGEDYETTVEAPNGKVQIIAEVETNGKQLVLKNVTIYGEKGDMVNQVPIGTYRAAVRQVQADAREAGFTSLRIQGVRVPNSSSANPGKTVDLNFDLTGPGTGALDPEAMPPPE